MNQSAIPIIESEINPDDLPEDVQAINRGEDLLSPPDPYSEINLGTNDAAIIFTPKGMEARIPMNGPDEPVPLVAELISGLLIMLTHGTLKQEAINFFRKQTQHGGNNVENQQGLTAGNPASDESKEQDRTNNPQRDLRFQPSEFTLYGTNSEETESSGDD